ncbi:MAG: CRISPR-associated helicase Cas3' [Magnetospirillum sp.]|nr:CRISPR-associated helicase Cas3' [Magnetospirillum sp.]
MRSLLLGRLLAHLDQVSADAKPSQVNDWRRAVLVRCLAMADQPAGVFSLSVPTGGGKTLASMAFALAHAKRWQKRRVISVIPYTSIIEQNTAVYRDALGAEMVLEHHSNFRHPDDRDGVEAEDAQKLRMAEENWDAPVVVTTSVQFFESLYSNRPSRCRKLHNIPGAVIVLDEAQLLPLPFLEPCLEALKLLVKDYGCTVVLCTATQPALADRDWLRYAFDHVTEIIENPTALHDALRRVEYTWAGRLSDGQLAEYLERHDQALTVVNTRRHARELFTLIRDLPGAVHLSAAMTPLHRAQILARIRQNLRDGRPCRVVSTQLVECGVDIDLPIVLRALAGLDSIIQAAGRCNRAGRPQPGQVTVFEPSDHGTPSPWREHANLARRVMTEEFPADPAAPEAVAWYFRNLFQSQDLDRAGILPLLAANARLNFSFRSAADAFRLIGDGQVDVTVPFDDEARSLIQQVETNGPRHDLLRDLQRHTVQIWRKDAQALKSALRTVGERVLVLTPAAYDAELGVVTRGE